MAARPHTIQPTNSTTISENKDVVFLKEANKANKHNNTHSSLHFNFSSLQSQRREDGDFTCFLQDTSFPYYLAINTQKLRDKEATHKTWEAKKYTMKLNSMENQRDIFPLPWFLFLLTLQWQPPLKPAIQFLMSN